MKARVAFRDPVHPPQGALWSLRRHEVAEETWAASSTAKLELSVSAAHAEALLTDGTNPTLPRSAECSISLPSLALSSKIVQDFGNIAPSGLQPGICQIKLKNLQISLHRHRRSLGARLCAVLSKELHIVTTAKKDERPLLNLLNCSVHADKAANTQHSSTLNYKQGTRLYVKCLAALLTWVQVSGTQRSTTVRDTHRPQTK